MALLPIIGGGAFEVRRIYCVGQNYRAHALEMGGDPDRQRPFYFQKPTDAILLDGAAMLYPPRTAALEHEVELVVAIGVGGADIAAVDASRMIFGYAVGLDMTRRDLQAQAKKASRPWDMAKGFDHSAPCGALTPASPELALNQSAIWLEVNGKRRQQSTLSQMIWAVPDVIADLSSYMRLEPGDLIFTGTPENVGPVQAGDHLHAHIDGLSDLHITISSPA